MITNGSLIPTQLLLEVDIRIHVNRGDGSKGCNNLSGTMEQFGYNNNNGYNNLSITSCHHELRSAAAVHHLLLAAVAATLSNLKFT